MELLCEKLKKLREAKNISQQEFAEKIFVSRSAVAKWEQGRGFPSIDSLQMIAKFYGVSIDELVSDKEIKILEIAATKTLSAKTKTIAVLSSILAFIFCLSVILMAMYCPRKLSAFIKIESEDITSIYIMRYDVFDENDKPIKIYLDKDKYKDFLTELKSIKVTPSYGHSKGIGSFMLYIECDLLIYRIDQYKTERGKKVYEYLSIATRDFYGLLNNYFKMNT